MLRSLIATMLLPLGGAAAQTPPCFSANDAVDTAPFGVTSVPQVGANRYAFALTPASMLTVRAIRILTRHVQAAASASLEIWSDDSTAQRPNVRLAGGVWQTRNVATEEWQGANLDNAVVLVPQAKYWIVWTERGGHELQVGGPTQFQTRLGNTVTGWQATTTSWAWKVRLYCSLLDAGGAAAYGAPCASSAGTSGTLFTSFVPAVGNVGFRLEGSGFPAGAPALVMFGVNASFASVDLTSAGATGCFLHTDLFLPGSTATGAGAVGYVASPGGHELLPSPVPNHSSLRGVFFAMQVAVYDGSSQNALPFVTSNAMRMRVQ